jgi:hypothetical protein
VLTTPARPCQGTQHVELQPSVPPTIQCDKCKSTDSCKQCFAPECTKSRCSECVLTLCRKNKAEALKDDDGDLVHVCTKVSICGQVTLSDT